ncbi:MAG TPA: pitrilysin family protein [Candidatus Limnocylindrales bacterium]|nr:pitrilysin family protein [Candidatus Limnocylindrales bacterium]
MKHLLGFCLLLASAFPARPASDFVVPVEAHKLGNGLRVVLSKDSAAPVVSVYVIYDVGARSEERGRTGFAHLFEHMMFEGSVNAPKGTQDEVVEGNGGLLNGSTHPDFTEYYDVLPSNKLASALWLEADRMRDLVITAEKLQNQKEAVQQERRLNFDNQPYNTAISDVWPTLIFRNWQSSHSIIGSFEDLKAATLGDVSKFFKTYYAPNNAVLLIVGDIQVTETLKLVETYFGDIPAQPAPKRVDLTEPDFQAKEETYKDPLARVPGVVMGYPGPSRRSPDFYAIHMIDAILTAGDSSRFRMDLVKGKESAIDYEADLGWPFAGWLDYRDPEPYALFIKYKPNFTADQVIAQVQDEFTRLQSEPVSAAELQRVKTQMRASFLRDMQSSLSRAKALAQYEVADHDAGLINTEMERMLAVTPEQIQAAAKKYFNPRRRAVLKIQPAGEEGK